MKLVSFPIPASQQSYGGIKLIWVNPSKITYITQARDNTNITFIFFSDWEDSYVTIASPIEKVIAALEAV